MTNGEKYLKDGTDRHFLTDFSRWYYAITRDIKNVDTILAQFLNEQVKPTLTEDERVILRNIQNGVPDKILTIKRFNGELFVLIKETADVFEIYMFDHLFQSIKERRRI